VKIARDAALPAGLVAVTAVVALLLGWYWAATVLALLALGVLAFFRDPARTIPAGPDLVVAPADGRVVAVEPEPPEPGEEAPRVRVSIFLSLFDVHINRSPVAATVDRVQYTPGSFLPAFQDKASQRNEQNRIDLFDGDRRLTMVQIAGLVARRIVCRARPGDQVARGQRIGLIKFGSRVDLYLPRTIELRVQVGDRVRGGNSVIGHLVDPLRDRA